MFRQPRRPAAAAKAASQPSTSQSEIQKPLQDWNVASTDLTKDEKDVAAKRVAALGGTLIAAMSTDTTVLIATKTGSPQHKIAYELDIPVVKSDWLDQVEALWRTGYPVDAKKVLGECRLGPFQGCSVCSPGLSQDVRGVIEKDVVQDGGRYTAELLKNRTTHLICDIGSRALENLTASWGGIKYVTTNWFKDTIKKLERADETLYPPPTEEIDVPSRSSGAGMRDLATVDELTLDPVTFDPPSNMYMEACQIFLCPSFSPEQVTQYKKIIRLAGGIHVPQYDQREVTHIVVPSNRLETSTLALLDADEELPFIVHQHWLRQSNRERKLAPESEHIVPFPTRTENGQPESVRMEGATNWTLDAVVIPIQGFEDLYVSTSGLDSTEQMHVERAVRLHGGHFHENIEKGVTNLLITDRPSGLEFEHMARNWLPIVRMDWLQRSIEEGICLPFDNFLLMPTRQSVSQGFGDYNDSSQQDTSVVPAHPGIPPSTPLAGLTVCIPNRVVGNLDELRTLARKLGAKVQTTCFCCLSDDSSVTHLIHHGEMSPEAVRDVRAANKAGVCVVAPSWLYKSDETGLREPEQEHPKVYGTETMVYKDPPRFFTSQTMPPPTALPVKRSQPSQSTPITRQGSASIPRVSAGGKSSIGKARATSVNPRWSTPSIQQDASQIFQGTAAGKLSVKFKSEPMTSASSNSSFAALGPVADIGDQDIFMPEAMEQDVQEHSDVMTVWQPAAYTSLPRDQLSRKRRRAMGPSEDPQGSSANPSMRSGVYVPSLDDYYRASQDDEARESKDVVYWFDSDERERKREFMAELGYKNTASLFPHPTDQPISERNDDPDPGTQPRPVKHFLLSRIGAEHRERCKKTIRALGGVVLEDESLNWDEWGKKCTHLLTNGENPPHTTKMVIAKTVSASILTKSYMFACEAAGDYVDEEPYRVSLC